MKDLAALSAILSGVAAVSIAEINGNRFISPYSGETVTDVEGLVTGVSKDGLFLRSTQPDDDESTSEGLYVYSSSAAEQVAVGDIVTLSGKVSEYRSNVDYLYLTELTSPTNITIISSGNEVRPLVIGKDTASPPTSYFSSLDDGRIFGVPNNVSLVSVENPKLQPEDYGLDFWESIMGELVTVTNAYGVSRPNQYGDVWVRGDWRVTGKNKHGGLTMSDIDANPEAIIIGTPLDGTTNPDDTKMGDYYGDITGVVHYAFGFYRILPLTHITPIRESSSEHSAVSFASQGTCDGITVASYNAENLAPGSTHLPQVVDQIVDKLRTPDLIFLQEVQDGSGLADDGVVSANLTLTTLTQSLFEASGIEYDFAEVETEDGVDGGQPGGNIRCAYLYRIDVVELHEPNQGGSLDANEVLEGPVLKYNPGRIDPANEAWVDSRKPVVAQWRAINGGKKTFFTVNVHFTSKGGSTSLHGDARPPVNKGVDQRTLQAHVTASFIAQILENDPEAYVIAAGDFNDFVQVEPLQVFADESGLTDLDEVARIPVNERYTYLFDMNIQALDHISSGHESPIEVVTPPTVTKKSRPAKATPKAAGGDCGEATGRSFSATEVKLLIEILATLGESSNGIKFNWTAISEKLDLPSAGATAKRAERLLKRFDLKMSDITGGGRNARTPKKTDGDITPAGKRKAGVLSDSFETLTKRRGGAKPGVKKEGDAQGPSATTAEGNGTSRIEVLIRADKISKAEVDSADEDDPAI
ncbi:hypothetical protein VUR80DRAFT_6670 [Thermomyces stellatus]